MSNKIGEGKIRFLTQEQINTMYPKPNKKKTSSGISPKKSAKPAVVAVAALIDRKAEKSEDELGYGTRGGNKLQKASKQKRLSIN